MPHKHEYDIEDEHKAYSYSEQQEKPLAEQSLEDFDEFFRQCKGLTFMFLTDRPTGSLDCVNTVYPDAISAIGLFNCATRGVSYIPHADETESHEVDAVNTPNIVAAVRERVAEMNRREVEYWLIWHFNGNDQLHVDFSGGSMDWMPLMDFLVAEVGDYLHAYLSALPWDVFNRTNIRRTI